MATEQCPVCKAEAKNVDRRDDRYLYDCARCGPYSISGSADAMLPSWLDRHPHNPAILSHVLCRMTRREQWAQLSGPLLQAILAENRLPTPREQLNNLIMWLGEVQDSPGDEIDDVEPAISAVGAADRKGLIFVIEQAQHQGMVNALLQGTVSGYKHVMSLRLTIPGWDYLEALQNSAPFSRGIFMAMKFGDSDADAVYTDHFRPAVAATGFTLKRLDEGQPAGLIDDRLRIEIRQCRMLIADLTHHNNGAYWEAGFAEGLGKPVIYTCRQDQFDKGTHFDTNHHLTVVWEPGKLPEAVKKLKDTIRATLPGEAKLTD